MDRRDEVESQHVLRLMARFAEDRAANRLKPLADYLAEFPSRADAVRAAYAEFAHEEGTDAELPRFGPYQLEREIGRGGHGVVYRARDTRLGRRVAVKMLSDGAAQSGEMRRRLAREAEAASKLDHPGICSVYDVGETAGVPYIAMRYVDGRSLTALIAEWRREREGSSAPSSRSGADERARLVRVVRLIESATRALGAAHDAKLVHRDIKPGNIMVTEDDEPVVLDFGVVRRDDVESQVLTRSGEAIGTPAYMPPEQLRGDRGAVDHRSDLYSLGATLYECATLQRPFRGPTLEALFAEIVTADPPNPRRLNGAISPDFAAVLDVALDKRPERRYQSAASFADDLRRLAENRPVSVRAAGPVLRLRRWYEQKPGLAFGVTAAFAILVLGLAASLYFLDRSIREGRRADRKTAEYERLSDTEQVESLIAEASELWPEVPSRIDDLERWLRRAERLRERLPAHRAALARLRARAIDPTPDDGDRSRGSASEREEIRGLEAQRAAVRVERRVVESEVDRIDGEIERLEETETPEPALLAALRKSRHTLIARRDELERAPAALTERIATLRRHIANRGELRFTDDVDAWLHGELAAMVSRIEGLVGPDSRGVLTIADVRRRLDEARSVRARTIDAHRARWDRTIEAIASSEHYGGLLIVPQLGLVPIGPDPRTGYHEFALVRSGDPPRRNPENGRLHLAPETGIVLVLLPGGVVELGAGLNEAFAQLSERPYRGNLAPFFIGKWEVTQAQFERVMESNPSHFYGPTEYDGGDRTGPMNPVENLDWYQALDFARRLALDLPTETQWEYACRGGARTSFAWGDSLFVLRGRDNVKDEAANRFLQDDGRHAKWDDGFAQHAPIDARIFQPNRFGLFAVHGNVSEWCRDAYALFRVVDAVRPGDGINAAYDQRKSRAFRGGNWMLAPPFARSAMRWSTGPTSKNAHLGMRVVRPVRE